MSDPKRRDQRTLEELAAARVDMTGAIGRHIELLVDAYATSDKPLSVAEASERARAPISAVSTAADDPQQVSWHTLGTLIEHTPEEGAALWHAIKAAAREELRTGTRTARSLERTFSTPFDRAQFTVILEGLTESLKPQGGVEHLLVQQMAAAYERWLRWQTIATQRTEQEQWTSDRDRRRMIEGMSKRERERYDYEHGWPPPRVSDAEAIEQAVLIADRYQRAFLRLLRTLRDMRRVMGSVVMMGGQLNVAERQVIVAAPAADDAT